MERRVFYIVLLWFSACFVQAENVTFATQRLQAMAGYLSLDCLDTLRTGSYDTYSYQGRPLEIRVNEWGEIEHIGLKLFSQQFRSIAPSPAYDFLERYLLERNAAPPDTEETERMQWDKVHFSIGDASSALRIDTTTQFTNNYVDLKIYRVLWTVEEKPILQITFDMDWLLMSGCTEIELEKNFLQTLRRIEKQGDVSLPMVDFPDEGNEYVDKGDFFMSPLVRNDRYYAKEDSVWHLVRSDRRMNASLSNMMLDANCDSTLTLQIVADLYGYQTDTLTSTYRKFLQLCMSEGCEPYFGLKYKEGEKYYGSVFLVNRQKGYLHLLSVNVDAAAIIEPRYATMWGRLYSYIPLFNVSDKILNPKDYEFVEEDET